MPWYADAIGYLILLLAALVAAASACLACAPKGEQS
jgi:hypothetical protein